MANVASECLELNFVSVMMTMSMSHDFISDLNCSIAWGLVSAAALKTYSDGGWNVLFVVFVCSAATASEWTRSITMLLLLMLWSASLLIGVFPWFLFLPIWLGAGGRLLMMDLIRCCFRPRLWMSGETMFAGACWLRMLLPALVPLARWRLIPTAGKLHSAAAANKLETNLNKSEFLWSTTARRQDQLNYTSIPLSDGDIRPSKIVRNLGVLIDSHLSFSQRVNSITRKSYSEPWRVKSFRRSLYIYLFMQNVR